MAHAENPRDRQSTQNQQMVGCVHSLGDSVSIPGPGTGDMPEGQYHPNGIPTGPTGWVCPVCGAGVSPYTTICPCRVTWGQYEVTCKCDQDGTGKAPDNPNIRVTC